MTSRIQFKYATNIMAHRSHSSHRLGDDQTLEHLAHWPRPPREKMPNIATPRRRSTHITTTTSSYSACCFIDDGQHGETSKSHIQLNISRHCLIDQLRVDSCRCGKLRIAIIPLDSCRKVLNFTISPPYSRNLVFNSRSFMCEVSKSVLDVLHQHRLIEVRHPKPVENIDAAFSTCNKCLSPTTVS